MHKMTNRLTILAVVTVLVLMAAFAAYHFQHYKYADGEDVHFLPNLVSQEDRVASIEISQGDKSLVIEKKGTEWGLAQKSDYPVKIQKIRELVQSMADLEIMEKKTAMPDRLAELDLKGVEKGSKTIRVVLYTSEGKALADAMIGSLRRTAENGRMQGAFYARRGNENQSYLVKGNVNIDIHDKYWLNTELLRINRAHIAEVNIKHNGKRGEDVVIKREAPKAKDKKDPNNPSGVKFMLSNLPKGKKVSSEMDIEAIVGVISDLNFTDVNAIDGKKLPKEPKTTISYALDGNLTVVLKLWEETAGKGKDAEHKYWVTIATETPKGQKLPPSIEDVVSRLNAYRPWVFEVGGYQGSLLTKTLKQLEKKK